MAEPLYAQIPLVYDMSELPGITGISRSLIYRAIRSGDLRAHKAGRRTLVMRDDAEAFLRNLPLAASNREGQ